MGTSAFSFALQVKHSLIAIFQLCHPQRLATLLTEERVPSVNRNKDTKKCQIITVMIATVPLLLSRVVSRGNLLSSWRPHEYNPPWTSAYLPAPNIGFGQLRGNYNLEKRYGEIKLTTGKIFTLCDGQNSQCLLLDLKVLRDISHIHQTDPDWPTSVHINKCSKLTTVALELNQHQTRAIRIPLFRPTMAVD